MSSAAQILYFAMITIGIIIIIVVAHRLPGDLFGPPSRKGVELPLGKRERERERERERAHNKIPYCKCTYCISQFKYMDPFSSIVISPKIK